MKAVNEHDEAVTLCQWWAYLAMRLKMDARLLIHIPNEGKRSRLAGWKLKEEGLRAGTPDYFLAIPVNPYNGLFIELKSPTGRLLPSQKEMLGLLDGRGYLSRPCYGAAEAIDVISRYLLPRQPGGAPSLAK